ncbi:hypothetical protein [Alteribacter aurantiacus]|uniref:hypothetical protein n=1 Tax=Alteribacter aurantiacus TaxID=254410 RepID=UPI000429FD4A|nr:hypothetical protein [Alteribacter aurantiacus]
MVVSCSVAAVWFGARFGRNVGVGISSVSETTGRSTSMLSMGVFFFEGVVEVLFIVL